MSPEIDSQLKASNSLLKNVQKQFNGERMLLSTKDAGTSAYQDAKEKNFSVYIMPYRIINSKCIIDINQEL